ncbi:MAG: hypothetical protein J6K48_10105 [Lachnospiraceae bacterium]|nr:hypothetical protein [Lachnospiraceae bacterium]
MKDRLKGVWQIITGIGGLIVVGLFLMAFFGAFDDEGEKIGNAEIFRGNDTKSVFSGDTELLVTEDGKVVGENKSGEEKPQGTSENRKGTGVDNNGNVYLQAGNSYTMENGSEVLITDIDIIYDFNNKSTIGYATVEYTNNSDDVQYLSPDDISAFVDDFQEPVDTRTAIMIDNVEYNGELLAIDPGRKGRYAYFTLFPVSGELAEKVEISLYGGSILYKEDGQWLYTDENADAIKEQTQAYVDSVEAQREWNERYESLPLTVMCPEEFSGAYIDTESGMLEGVDLLDIIPGRYANTTNDSMTEAIVNEDGTLSLKNGVFQFDNLALYQDLSGAFSIDAEANYKVGFLGSGYIYIWTPDEVDPDNIDEGFYEKVE